MQKLIDKYWYAKDWYVNANQLIRNLFGDDAFLFIDILAAISPQTTISKNWNLAVRVYTDFKAKRKIDLSGFWGCHKANIMRALERKELSGNKVRNFAENLKGNLQAVTIDTWILRYLKWNKNHWPTKNQYNKLAKRIRRLAKKYNLKPAELQAIIWTAIREKAGYDYKDFLIASGEIPI